MADRPGKYFTWSEFDVDHVRPLPMARRPAFRLLVVEYLDPLREKFGRTYVASSLRTPRYNRVVGGAKASMHLTTAPVDVAAADVWCATGKPWDWADFLEELNPGGLGRYMTHVHCDTRHTRARW